MIIASLGVPTVPATTPLADNDLHPNGDGYLVWAQEIAQTVGTV